MRLELRKCLEVGCEIGDVVEAARDVNSDDSEVVVQLQVGELAQQMHHEGTGRRVCLLTA